MAAIYFAFLVIERDLASVLIEASALKLPVVASKIYGIEDAVLDNVTGLLFKVGNLDDLVKSIIRLLDDNQLCKNLGYSGFERVKTKVFKGNL